MNRRKILITGGVGVSGLAGFGYFRGWWKSDREVQVERGSNPNGELEVTVDLIDNTITSDSPAKLTITAKNTTDTAINYGTGSPPPFGILFAGDHVLWTDTYRTHSNVLVEGDKDSVTTGGDVGHGVDVPPGESVAESYEFSAPSGTYPIEREYDRPFTLNDTTYDFSLVATKKGIMAPSS